MSKRPPTALDTMYLDPADTTALVADPPVELRRLGMDSIDHLLPDLSQPWVDLPSSIIIVVANTTPEPLIVTECADIHGSLTHRAWDQEAEDERVAPAPSAMLGDGSSCVGVWSFCQGAGQQNPSSVVKFSTGAGLDRRPIYVAGDITDPLIGSFRLSCSVGNFDHGSAAAYFDQFVDGGPDYRARTSASGHVTAQGYASEYRDSKGYTRVQWIIGAVVRR